MNEARFSNPVRYPAGTVAMERLVPGPTLFKSEANPLVADKATLPAPAHWAGAGYFLEGTVSLKSFRPGAID